MESKDRDFVPCFFFCVFFFRPSASRARAYTFHSRARLWKGNRCPFSEGNNVFVAKLDPDIPDTILSPSLGMNEKKLKNKKIIIRQSEKKKKKKEEK